MTLHIVRHGRTEANASGLLLGRADPGLDPIGRTQADKIASWLGRPDRLVSSPLRRCMETAEAFGVEIEADDRAIELDYGDFDLTPVRDVPAEVWREWRRDPTFRPPGGETLVELQVRVGELLDELAADAIDRDVVVLTHVSPVKASMAWALGVGAEVSWRSFVAQASITTIGVTANGPSLRSFNSEHHLG
ncbi:MAG: histidine phosphatase family protein [Actinomycetota bacterium]